MIDNYIDIKPRAIENSENRLLAAFKIDDATFTIDVFKLSKQINVQQTEPIVNNSVGTFGLNEEQFKAIMSDSVRSHLEFKSYMTGLYLKHEKFMRTIKPITKLIKLIKFR